MQYTGCPRCGYWSCRCFEPREKRPSSCTSALLCSVCGKPHRLTELDAGSDQEFMRLCDKCFRKQNTRIADTGGANAIKECNDETEADNDGNTGRA